jgi:hypothetical protein
MTGLCPAIPPPRLRARGDLMRSHHLFEIPLVQCSHAPEAAALCAAIRSGWDWDVSGSHARRAALLCRKISPIAPKMPLQDSHQTPSAVMLPWAWAEPCSAALRYH